MVYFDWSAAGSRQSARGPYRVLCHTADSGGRGEQLNALQGMVDQQWIAETHMPYQVSAISTSISVSTTAGSALSLKRPEMGAVGKCSQQPGLSLSPS